MAFDSLGAEHVGAMREKKDYSSKMVLNFFRHGEKNNTPGTDELSKEGRRKAVAEFAKRFPENKNSHRAAFGSWIKRSGEAAALALAGSNLDSEFVDNYSSLKDLTNKINAEAISPDGEEGLKYGSKIGVHKNLGFKFAKTGKAIDAYNKHASEGTYLRWLADESDAVIQVDNDDVAWGLSRQAANIASEIDRYVKISGNFDRLVTKKSTEDGGKNFGDTLERFLGSHQGVLESFLVKLIEKTKGTKEKERFVNVLPEGFGFLEGFTVEIEKQSNQTEPQVRIKYERKSDDEEKSFQFDEVVSSSILQEIILEGNK